MFRVIKHNTLTRTCNYTCFASSFQTKPISLIFYVLVVFIYFVPVFQSASEVFLLRLSASVIARETSRDINVRCVTISHYIRQDDRVNERQLHSERSETVRARRRKNERYKISWTKKEFNGTAFRHCQCG